MRLIDKSIIVTGGAKGIGRVYCKRIVEEGGRILIADIDIEHAQDLAEKLNRLADQTCAVARKVDVTSEQDTQEMAETLVNHFGSADVLINNAGVYPHVKFEDISYDEWRRVMRINLDSVFLGCKAVLPYMKKQRKGKIINISTDLVWVGLAGMVHYVASKAGIIGFTRSLAREYGEYGINVNGIAPGPIIPEGHMDNVSRMRMEMIRNQQCIKRFQQPEDLAGAVVFLASADSDFISGQIFNVDGGLTNH